MMTALASRSTVRPTVGRRPLRVAAEGQLISRTAPLTREQTAAYLKTLPGATFPMGLWDPLGFANGKTMQGIDRLREAEVTHGRVCMLGAVGFVVGESFNPLFDGRISGPAIYQAQQVPQDFWSYLVFSVAVAEGYRAAYGWTKPGEGGLFTLMDQYLPGDLGFDPLGLKPSNKADRTTMLNKELNNGRLAMVALAGMVAQELKTGEKLL